MVNTVSQIYQIYATFSHKNEILSQSGGWGGGLTEPPNALLNPPLRFVMLMFIAHRFVFQCLGKAGWPLVISFIINRLMLSPPSFLHGLFYL